MEETSLTFFFNFTVVKRIACWRCASGKENTQHSQTLFSSVWPHHNPAQCRPGPLQSHTNVFSQEAFNSIITSRKGARYKEFEITRWRIQTYSSLETSLSELRADWIYQSISICSLVPWLFASIHYSGVRESQHNWLHSASVLLNLISV